MWEGKDVAILHERGFWKGIMSNLEDFREGVWYRVDLAVSLGFGRIDGLVGLLCVGS